MVFENSFRNVLTYNMGVILYSNEQIRVNFANDPVFRFLVSLCIDLTLFGSSVVFLLLASENISFLIQLWAEKDISFCFLMLAVAVALLPATFLGSPKDFW